MHSERRRRKQANVHVDPCTNHWYIAMHGESSVPRARLAGTQAWQLIRSRSFTQFITERKHV
jgi:hypothetical protein